MAFKLLEIRIVSLGNDSHHQKIALGKPGKRPQQLMQPSFKPVPQYNSPTEPGNDECSPAGGEPILWQNMNAQQVILVTAALLDYLLYFIRSTDGGFARITHLG